MDNFHINVKADKGLKEILNVAFLHNHNKVTGYAIRPKGSVMVIGQMKIKPLRLVYYKYKIDKPDVHNLPFEYRLDMATEFALSWLKSLNNEDYADKIDHDGSDLRGFHVWNEDWGHVDNDYEAFVAISPVWAWYGK